MKILIIIIGAIISGILYRLGGAAKKDNWLDILRNTKTRDIGCPLIALILMLIYYPQVAWWVYSIAFVAMFGAMTTYWDKVFKEDNFYMHGFMIGLAYLPYLLVVPWYLIVFRAIVLGLFMGIWCKIFSNAVTEEVGRGAAITATLILLLLVSGCASQADFTRDDVGRVTHIKVDGQLKGSVKTDAEEITFDSKNEPIISDLINVNAYKEGK